MANIIPQTPSHTYIIVLPYEGSTKIALLAGEEEKKTATAG